MVNTLISVVMFKGIGQTKNEPNNFELLISKFAAKKKHSSTRKYLVINGVVYLY